MSKIFKKIKKNNMPFIISEIGVNYYDIAEKKQLSLIDAAKLMVDKAQEVGSDAVKFQSYKAEKIASKNSPAYWDLEEEPTASQYKLFTKFDKFGYSEYKILSRYCNEKNIIFMSTPFDFEAADYLDELMPIYKISSSDITNHPFIEHIAKKGKPVFLSTGASTIAEIEEAVNIILEAGNTEICIMHCILDYPTAYENVNLNMIKHLKEVFPDFLIGFSDHTLPDKSMLVLITAYQYGAKVIEKHFTLDKNLKGNDHYHAMDPSDLKKYIQNVNLLEKISGDFYKRPLSCEQNSRRYARRSIVAQVDIKQGEIITRDKVSFKRPGTGISPKDLNKILGKKATDDIFEDELLRWKNI